MSYEDRKFTRLGRREKKTPNITYKFIYTQPCIYKYRCEYNENQTFDVNESPTTSTYSFSFLRFPRDFDIF